MSSESSFFLVRLLQRVESIELVPEAFPEGTLPPKEWKDGSGRKAYEQVWPRSHLTIYSKVRSIFIYSLIHREMPAYWMWFYV